MIRGLQNTAFVEKMIRAPPCVGVFQKSSAPTDTKSKQKEVQKYMNCKRSLTKRLLSMFITPGD